MRQMNVVVPAASDRVRRRRSQRGEKRRESVRTSLQQVGNQVLALGVSSGQHSVAENPE
jgi:hypothetical protein